MGIVLFSSDVKEWDKGIDLDSGGVKEWDKGTGFDSGGVKEWDKKKVRKKHISAGAISYVYI